MGDQGDKLMAGGYEPEIISGRKLNGYSLAIRVTLGKKNNDRLSFAGNKCAVLDRWRLPTLRGEKNHVRP